MKQQIKQISVTGAALLLSMAAACSFEAEDKDYRLAPPPVPAVWSEILGVPRWRLEWIDENGALQGKETAGLEGERVRPYPHAATPISAAPYWPEKGIYAGVFYAAGAVYPLDVREGAIRLSWQGGVDAHFYRLLAELDNEKRLPQNFDWKRFRELFTGGKIEKEALADPWLVNWEEIAQKTAASSFSASRIKARKSVFVNVTVPAAGPWAGRSPFTPYFDWKPGEAVSVGIVSPVEQFYCPQGVFRCAKNAAIFRAFAEPAGPPQP